MQTQSESKVSSYRDLLQNSRGMKEGKGSCKLRAGDWSSTQAKNFWVNDRDCGRAADQSRWRSRCKAGVGAAELREHREQG